MLMKFAVASCYLVLSPVGRSLSSVHVRMLQRAVAAQMVLHRPQMVAASLVESTEENNSNSSVTDNNTAPGPTSSSSKANTNGETSPHSHQHQQLERLVERAALADANFIVKEYLPSNAGKTQYNSSSKKEEKKISFPDSFSVVGNLERLRQHWENEVCENEVLPTHVNGADNYCCKSSSTSNGNRDGIGNPRQNTWNLNTRIDAAFVVPPQHDASPLCPHGGVIIGTNDDTNIYLHLFPWSGPVVGQNDGCSGVSGDHPQQEGSGGWLPPTPAKIRVLPGFGELHSMISPIPGLLVVACSRGLCAVNLSNLSIAWQRDDLSVDPNKTTNTPSVSMACCRYVPQHRVLLVLHRKYDDRTYQSTRLMCAVSIDTGKNLLDPLPLSDSQFYSFTYLPSSSSSSSSLKQEKKEEGEGKGKKQISSSTEPSLPFTFSDVLLASLSFFVKTFNVYLDFLARKTSTEKEEEKTSETAVEVGSTITGLCMSSNGNALAAQTQTGKTSFFTLANHAAPAQSSRKSWNLVAAEGNVCGCFQDHLAGDQYVIAKKGGTSETQNINDEATSPDDDERFVFYNLDKMVSRDFVVTKKKKKDTFSSLEILAVDLKRNLVVEKTGERSWGLKPMRISISNVQKGIDDDDDAISLPQEEVSSTSKEQSQPKHTDCAAHHQQKEEEETFDEILFPSFTSQLHPLFPKEDIFLASGGHSVYTRRYSYRGCEVATIVDTEGTIFGLLPRFQYLDATAVNTSATVMNLLGVELSEADSQSWKINCPDEVFFVLYTVTLGLLSEKEKASPQQWANQSRIIADSSHRQGMQLERCQVKKSAFKIPWNGQGRKDSRNGFAAHPHASFLGYRQPYRAIVTQGELGLALVDLERGLVLSTFGNSFVFNHINAKLFDGKLAVTYGLESNCGTARVWQLQDLDISGKGPASSISSLELSSCQASSTASLVSFSVDKHTAVVLNSFIPQEISSCGRYSRAWVVGRGFPLGVYQGRLPQDKVFSLSDRFLSYIDDLDGLRIARIFTVPRKKEASWRGIGKVEYEMERGKPCSVGREPTVHGCYVGPSFRGTTVDVQKQQQYVDPRSEYEIDDDGKYFNARTYSCLEGGDHVLSIYLGAGAVSLAWTRKDDLFVGYADGLLRLFRTATLLRTKTTQPE